MEDEQKALQTILDRFAVASVHHARAALRTSVAELVAAMTPEGDWPDLLYRPPPSDPTPGSTSVPHLTRLQLIAAAAMPPEAPAAGGKPDDALVDVVRRGLAFWLREGSPYTKIWFHLIGEPTELAPVLVLARSYVSTEQMRDGLTVLSRPVAADGELHYAHAPATGQNLVWMARNQIVSACLTGDVAKLRLNLGRIAREIAPTTREGIQPDASFHQHGPQLYAGGYGEGFALDCVATVAFVHGTPFPLPDKSRTLVRYVLDGQQWMTRRRAWDWGVIGREIARAGRDAAGLAEACDTLAGFDPDRAGELAAFARRLRRQDPASAAPAGVKMFWRSDFASAVRPAGYASVRMSSRRVCGTESGNGENELGHHLGHGATCLMRDGEEYLGLFPLWDWHQVPGVTCPYTPDVPLPLQPWGSDAFNPADFVGGVTDGADGCCAMELAHGGVRGQKAWFFVGPHLVCLGRKPAAHDPASPLVTGINQCHARGPVRVRDAADGKPLTIEHDGVAYAFLADADRVRHDVVSRTGTWRTLSRQHGASSEIKADVFSLRIEHGPGVAAYHYAVTFDDAPADQHRRTTHACGRPPARRPPRRRTAACCRPSCGRPARSPPRAGAGAFGRGALRRAVATNAGRLVRRRHRPGPPPRTPLGRPRRPESRRGIADRRRRSRPLRRRTADVMTG